MSIPHQPPFITKKLLKICGFQRACRIYCFIQKLVLQFRNGTNTIQRLNYVEYGIGERRLEELQNGCRVGAYSSEILTAACRGIEDISPWILLSVKQGKSFDVLSVEWELGKMERPPYCRTDFYSCRRRFFANLDKEMKERGNGWTHKSIWSP